MSKWRRTRFISISRLKRKGSLNIDIELFIYLIKYFIYWLNYDIYGLLYCIIWWSYFG